MNTLITLSEVLLFGGIAIGIAVSAFVLGWTARANRPDLGSRELPRNPRQL